MTETCKNCRWWSHAGEKGCAIYAPKWLDGRNDEKVLVGICHRYAPREQCGPNTTEDYWCGEWERKNVVEPIPTPIDKNFDR